MVNNDDIINNNSDGPEDSKFVKDDYVPVRFRALGDKGEITVYCNTITGKRVAVKQQSDGNDAENEVRILKKIKSDKIIEYFHHYQEKEQMYIFMELADIDLCFYILNSGPITDSLVFWQWAIQIAEGLSFLHHSGFMHRSLKPRNILVVGNRLKLADFGGTCQITNEPVTWKGGTHETRAPERLLALPYTEKIDVWGLGCVYVYMANRRIPFSSRSFYERIVEIGETVGYSPKLRQRVYQKMDMFRDKYPVNDYPFCELQSLGRTNYNVIVGCLKSDPDYRFNADEVVKHLNKFVMKKRL